MDLRADSDLRASSASRRGHPHPVKSATHHLHTRRVGVLRVILPATALVLLVLLGVWPSFRGGDDRFQVGFSTLTPAAVENLSMVNARYHGIDKRNNPFTVTADRGTEEDPKNGVVVLDNPKADFVTESGAGVYVEAKLGTYYQQEEWLDLEGDVNLYHDQGYEMHTQAARLYLRESRAEGHAPVSGKGPQGRIEGKGFQVSDEGRRLIVLGQSGVSLKAVGKKK